MLGLESRRKIRGMEMRCLEGSFARRGILCPERLDQESLLAGARIREALTGLGREQGPGRANRDPWRLPERGTDRRQELVEPHDVPMSHVGRLVAALRPSHNYSIER